MCKPIAMLAIIVVVASLPGTQSWWWEPSCHPVKAPAPNHGSETGARGLHRSLKNRDQGVKRSLENRNQDEDIMQRNLENRDQDEDIIQRSLETRNQDDQAAP